MISTAMVVVRACVRLPVSTSQPTKLSAANARTAGTK
jgi:hypothetical protein